jgi:hypothetical protein
MSTINPTGSFGGLLGFRNYPALRILECPADCFDELRSKNRCLVPESPVNCSVRTSLISAYMTCRVDISTAVTTLRILFIVNAA